MLIDWFTIIAQFINFFILVWLLKRFLYQPILRAIDQREAQISAKLLNAQEIKSQAEKESLELNSKIKKIDEQTKDLLRQAVKDADEERERLFEEAKQSVTEFTKQKRDDFRREENQIHQSIIQQMQTEIFAICRKVLMDLSGIKLETHIVNIFIQQLSDLVKEKKNIKNSKSFSTWSSSSTSTNEGLVRSTVELTTEQRTIIDSTICQYLNKKIQIQFEIVPDLFSGIEFIMNGQKLVWSIGDYLISLEKEVNYLLHPEKEEL